MGALTALVEKCLGLCQPAKDDPPVDASEILESTDASRSFDQNGRIPATTANSQDSEQELEHGSASKMQQEGGEGTPAPSEDPANEEKPLKMAVKTGNMKMVELLLPFVKNINATDSENGTALQVAAHFGHTPIVSELLSQGADPNITAGQFTCALQSAVNENNEDLVKLLLDAKADPNSFKTGRAGEQSALLFTIELGYQGIVKLLLDAGADPNTPDVLPRAAGLGQESSVRILISAGADVNIQDSRTTTAIQAASREGHSAIVKLLIENQADVDLALMDAVVQNKPEIVKLLLFEGEANVNSPGALAHAAWYGYLPIVQDLLDAGGDVDIPGKYSKTALELAAGDGHIDVVKLLLTRGGGHLGDALMEAIKGKRLEMIKLLLTEGKADPNTPNALHYAAWYGYLPVVQDLLDAGADVNIPGKNNQSALEAAAADGHIEVVKLLLARGADTNSANRGNALMEAITCNRSEMVKLLLSEGKADPNTPNALPHAAWYGYLSIVEDLLDAGAEVDILGRHSKTALEEAAGDGHIDVVKLLLSHRADANRAGGNALMQAIKGQKPEMVKLLLSEGKADLNTPDALPYAAWYGYVSIVEDLLDAGADVNIKNQQEKTAIQLAARDGLVDVVTLLLLKGADPNLGVPQSPLMEAVINNKPDVVKLLLSQGVDVNLQDQNATAAIQLAARYGLVDVAKLLLVGGGLEGGIEGKVLMEAVRHNHPEMVKLLLCEGKVDPNTPNALFHATQHGYVPIVEQLVEAGADVNTKDQHTTTLQIAAKYGLVDVAKILLAKGVDLNLAGEASSNALMDAINHNQLDMVKFLLFQGKANSISPDVLPQAAWHGNLPVVEELIEAGVDVNIEDYACTTALQAAARRGHETVVTFLLHSGADINIASGPAGGALLEAINHENLSVVQLLLHPPSLPSRQIPAANPNIDNVLHRVIWRGQLAMVIALLDGGADINARNEDGLTPLMIACQKGREDVAKLLCERGADLDFRGGQNGERTAIGDAIQGGFDGLVMVLLERGAVPQ